MKIQYLFSSENGDIPIDNEDLKRPLLISPSNPHPFLTLGDYFNAMKKFILKEKASIPSDPINGAFDQKIDPSSTEKILIRSEKHGSLYHVASLEVFTGNSRYKFALSTALSQDSGDHLSFFEALREKEAEGECYAVSVQEFLELLKSFKEEELKKLFNALMAFYKKENTDYYPVIESHLTSHTGELISFITNLGY